MSAEFALLFGLATFNITYVASRVGRHSKIHMDIADLAISAEVLTVLAALLWMWVGGEGVARDVAHVGVLITLLCFLLAALTDRWVQRVWRKIVETMRGRVRC